MGFKSRNKVKSQAYALSSYFYFCVEEAFYSDKILNHSIWHECRDVLENRSETIDPDFSGPCHEVADEVCVELRHLPNSRIFGFWGM